MYVVVVLLCCVVLCCVAVSYRMSVDNGRWWLVAVDVVTVVE